MSNQPAVSFNKKPLGRRKSANTKNTFCSPPGDSTPPGHKIFRNHTTGKTGESADTPGLENMDMDGKLQYNLFRFTAKTSDHSRTSNDNESAALVL